MRWALLALGTHLVIWMGVGFAENNWLIPFSAATAALFGILMIAILGFGGSAVRVLSVGLLVRTVLCVLAWYQSKGTEYEYWTGLNEDSNRFFIKSYLPLNEAIWTTEDKGFPAINSIITAAASAWGQDHYLVNVQIVLACGALFAIATYAWARETIDERTATAASWIIALHPIVIGWSTGLMRDTLIAAFGWFMVAALLRLGSLRRESFIKMSIVFAISAIAAWHIRNMTCAYLLGVSGLMFLLGRTGTIKVSTKLSAVLVLIVTIIIIIGSTDVLERFEKSWTYGVRFRSDVGVDETTVNDGGISARMAQSGSTLVYLVAAPYAFFAPFPVYATPEGAKGEPGRLVDYLFNAGGLINLLAFVLLLPGVFMWWRERRWDMIVLSGPCFWSVCTLCILAGGQSRWVMPFLYPIIAATIAHLVMDARSRRNGFMQLIIGAGLAILGIYTLYWGLKLEAPIWVASVISAPIIVMSLLISTQIGSSVFKKERSLHE